MAPQETPESTPEAPSTEAPKPLPPLPWFRVVAAVVIVGAAGTGLWRRIRRSHGPAGFAHYDPRILGPFAHGTGRLNDASVRAAPPLTPEQIRTLGYRAVVYPLTEGSRLGTARIARIEAPGEQPFIGVVLDTLVPHTLRVVRAERLPSASNVHAQGNYGVYLAGSPPWDSSSQRVVAEAMQALEYFVGANARVPVPQGM